MKAMIKAACLLATAMVPMLLANPAAAQSTMTRDQQIGYLGETSTSALSRGVLSRLKNQNHVRRVSDTTDRIVMWHEILLDAVALDHTPDPDTGKAFLNNGGPVRTARAMAMVQIAVFDAVNAFDEKYKSYNRVNEAPELASKDAAIAFAAHDALVAIFPSQAARFDVLLNGDLGDIRGGQVRIALGRAVGKQAAAAIIARRTNDNSVGTERNFGFGGRVATGTTNFYNEPVNGGSHAVYNWEPDPLTPGANNLPAQLALGAFWGSVKPFALRSGAQFRIPPPPVPGSAAYNNGFNGVKAIGASTDTAGSTSTETTRFIGNFWGYDGAPLLGTPPRLYSQIAVRIAQQEGIRKPIEMARYLAMIAAAQGDSGIAAWDSKYFYNYWRPVTGVRRANEDGSAATVADPAWKPFGVSVINTTKPVIATPPFPAYPSGHATFGAAIVTVMKSYFPDRTAFTFVSDEYSGEGVDPFGAPRPLVPVRFRTLSDIQDQNGISRVYNGVHWQWDNSAGQTLGQQVGTYFINHAFQPERERD